MNKTIKIIVLAMLCLNFSSQAQQTTNVQGRVVGEDNQPLNGALIQVMGTRQVAATDKTGHFFLQKVSKSARLFITYLGCQGTELNASADVGTIKLSLKTDNLQEVAINAGYYTVKERERTGSITRVNAKDISSQPVSNPLAALIGRMAGVNVEQQSGINGGGFKVEIRGINSLRPDGRLPLYLVDGIPYPAGPINSNLSVDGISQLASPLNYISPADIESIEVLKDADATAIYGSRGANGVILIQTKKGKTGKTTIDINFNTGIAKVTRKLKLLNTQQYLQMRNEAFKNDNLTPGATDYDINGTWDQNRYTDWQKELIGGTARNTNINTSLSGGTENTQFSFRANYNKQGTVSPGNFSDQKGSGALNLNHTSANKLFKANFTSTYALDNNQMPKFDFTQYIDLAPNAPALYNPDGSLNWALNNSGVATWNNPIATIYSPYQGKTNTFLSNAQLSYQILQGLSIKTNFGYTNIRLSESNTIFIKSLSPSPSNTASKTIANNYIETWIAEPQINYQRFTTISTIDILMGATFQKDRQSSESLSGNNQTSDILVNNITSAPSRTASASSSQYNYLAFFGRINYKYQGKYILNLTGRRDGSSRFGPDKQFANFGAIGAAWLFGDEQAIKSIFPILSYGKLRASYGITGSDQIPNYGYLETYTTSTFAYRDGAGLFPSRLANPDYSWETNRKMEFALELGVLKDRMMLNTSWYRNRSSNQLVGYTLPDITGFSSIQYNLPATVQNKGWEFELHTINIKNQNFNWQTSVNISIPQNKLISYPNIQGSTYANIYTVGQSLYLPKVYHLTGVDQQTGLYTFADLNNNSTVDAADLAPAQKALTTHAFAGIQNSFSYKGLSLDFHVQLVSKTLRDPAGTFSPPGSLVNGTQGNQLQNVMDRWQNPGQQTSTQKFSQITAPNSATDRFFYLLQSNRFTNASFIRLKNVMISWQFPKSLVNKAKLTNLRLYLQAQNLFTISKYPGDPEIGTYKTLPSLTMVNAGIQVNL